LLLLAALPGVEPVNGDPEIVLAKNDFPATGGMKFSGTEFAQAPAAGIAVLHNVLIPPTDAFQFYLFRWNDGTAGGDDH
jgi:hypothetical protein